MNVKHLRKQLMAAIAMVLVAAIALGSSTFAWFITNNEVKATTSKISAQSNAAFMVIKYDSPNSENDNSAVSSDLTADSATINDTPLYPAQWNTTDGKFETAFAESSSAPGMKEGTLKNVGEQGTPDQAVAAEYAVLNTFNISSKGTGLTNLKVVGASIVGGNEGNTHLNDALRVLVVTTGGWVLCDKSSIVASSNSTAGLLGDTITPGQDTLVKMYVFYDGNEDEIYTNNIGNLKDASAKITVQFSATEDLTSQDAGTGKTN